MVAVAGLVGLSGSAVEAAPGPMRGGFTAHAPQPDPTSYFGLGPHFVCNMTFPQSWDSRPFVAPGAGSLALTVSGFTGDWDLLVLDSRGRDVAVSHDLDFIRTDEPGVDRALLRIRRAARFTVTACNTLGSDTATVSWVFTPAKR